MCTTHTQEPAEVSQQMTLDLLKLGAQVAMSCNVFSNCFTSNTQYWKYFHNGLCYNYNF